MDPALFEQPIELLVKQLSDPDVTFQDIQNLCRLSTRGRELCNTEPLLIKLIEGKRTAVRIDRYSSDEEEHMWEPPMRFFTIIIYAYLGELVTESVFDITSDAPFSDSLANVKAGEWVIIYDVWFHLDGETQKVSIGAMSGDDDFSKIVAISMPYPLFESIFTEMQRMIDNAEYGELRILMNGDIQLRN